MLNLNEGISNSKHKCKKLLKEVYTLEGVFNKIRRSFKKQSGKS
jgi:hypothetical protein